MRKRKSLLTGYTKFGILDGAVLRKELHWLGSSRRSVKSFPKDTKKILGRELDQIQLGGLPGDWRPMPEVGSGVMEIRIHRPGEYRIFYIANYPEAVYVLHAFQKKTQATSEKDKQIGIKQYAELQNVRQQNKKNYPG